MQVSTGGSDAILHLALDEKLLELYEAIASLAAQPKNGEEHILALNGYFGLKLEYFVSTFDSIGYFGLRQNLF